MLFVRCSNLLLELETKMLTTKQAELEAASSQQRKQLEDLKRMMQQQQQVLDFQESYTNYLELVMYIYIA